MSGGGASYPAPLQFVVHQLTLFLSGGRLCPPGFSDPSRSFVPDRDRGDAVVRSRVGGNGQITCVSYT